MKVAVSVSSNFTKVSGHAGRSRKWLVFPVGADRVPGPPERVEISGEMVFHHHDGSGPHPLDGIDTLITLSAGDGFLAKMRQRGVEAALTSETDPARAVACHLAGTLAPPKPRPVGELVCKAIDRLTRPRRA